MCLVKHKVHGDIRHLEKIGYIAAMVLKVHGDIRHLEIVKTVVVVEFIVHGDIRHLEKTSHDAPTT